MKVCPSVYTNVSSLKNDIRRFKSRDHVRKKYNQAKPKRILTTNIIFTFHQLPSAPSGPSAALLSVDHQARRAICCGAVLASLVTLIKRQEPVVTSVPAHCGAPSTPHDHAVTLRWVRSSRFNDFKRQTPVVTSELTYRAAPSAPHDQPATLWWNGSLFSREQGP